ncbi:uncharacterized protein LOC123225129 isoform X2 [Mangifera indica]|uniref:uncharacterized protein LOC123225129 isoform X2 n=1 Tax=Mangifera indica TaxID=29780 RepID=UPI001CF99501|nr:uncharacterized protein LOC123225129 isoform X2 [Mangifera indica]
MTSETPGDLLMDLDAPLDFETEDPFRASSIVKNKRKKIIGLDDLLTDHYKQKSKLIEKEKKRAKAKKNYNSDEDESGKEALLSNIVNSCQNQMEDISGEDEVSEWGLQVFGDQKTPPCLVPKLDSCQLLQSFTNNEVNSLLELSTEKGDSFLEGLLVNGWLSKLVFATGQVENSIATWTFNLKELRTSACNFWCAILSYKKEVDADAQPLKIDWFPSYSELHKALVTYGFSSDFSSTVESVNKNSRCRGPPQNLIVWVKFTAACCQVRCKKSIFSTEEAEMLVEVVIGLFLDRQLLGLSVHLHQCLQSAISYFTEKEWNTSCEEIAKSLAHRVPLDLNCLRTVDCISGVHNRSKHLRSAIAYQILVHCFNKASNEEEILNLLITINVRDKNCDLFKMYVYLVLTENWLLSCPKLEEKPVINEMWGVYLRNCSCHISSTDLRPYASKVRNKASYLLQGPFNN